MRPFTRPFKQPPTLLLPCLLLAAPFLAFGGGFDYVLPADAWVQAVAVDAAGNAYLTGHTASLSFPATPGAFQTQPGGGECNALVPIPFASGLCDDAFVIKLDAAGSVVWATYLGGDGEDSGQAIAVDGSGNVYVAGATQFATYATTNSFPTTPGAVFPALTEAGNAFVVKLNPAGSQMIYGTFIPDHLTTVAMAIDGNGNAYVAAQEEPSQYSFPATAGAFQVTSSARASGVVLKLNPAGSALLYATYLGGNGQQDITQLVAIAVDSSGNAYVTGVGPADFPVTAGAYQTASTGGAFVAKLNASGSALVYSTFLGRGDDEGTSIKVDGQGRAYVLGQALCRGTCPPTNSTDFLTTPGALEPAGALQPPWSPVMAGVNQFLGSLSADGSTLVYGTYVEGALVLDVDPSGDAYVAGLSAGSGLPVSAGATEPCYDSNDFAAEFDPTGALEESSYFGAAGTFSLSSMAAGPGGVVWIGTGNFVDSLLINNPQVQNGPCLSPVVQNAASYYSYGTQVAPGELVTLQGVGMGPQAGVSGIPDANGMLPANLAGVQVLFDNVAAPLMYLQSGQINAQAPWEIAGQKSTQVQVLYQGVMTNTVTLSVAQVVPGLFYLSYPSRQAAILNADGSINSATNAAKAGDVIALFGTGGGPTSPAGMTGAIWATGANTPLIVPATVQIGGINAPVVYAGAAPGLLSGFFQINVQIPPGVPQSPTVSINLYFGLLDGNFLGETTNQATIALQ